MSLNTTLNTTVMAHEAFEMLTGNPISNASNSDFDTAETNLHEHVHATISQIDEIVLNKLDAAGFGELAIALKNLSIADEVFDLAKQI